MRIATHKCGACRALVASATFYPTGLVAVIERAADGDLVITPTLLEEKRPLVKRTVGRGEWKEHLCTGRGRPSFSAANFDTKRRPTP